METSWLSLAAETTGASTTSWKLNSTLLNDKLITEVIKKEIKTTLGLNEKKNLVYGAQMKAVLRGKFTVKLLLQNTRELK